MSNTIFEARSTYIEYTEGQTKALEKIVTFLKSDDHFFLLAGFSGCGKTTIAENIANYARAKMLAPTNAAVNRLREKIPGNHFFSTIHAQMYVPTNNDGFNLEKGLIANSVYIVDECSMIDNFILKDLIKEAFAKRSKIIFIGDSFQLEPVGEDPHLFKWEMVEPIYFKPENRFELNEVKRYDGDLLKIATELRSKPENKIKNNISINGLNSPDLLSEKKFTNALLKDIKNNSSYIVLTSTNQKRVDYNEKIRAVKYKTNEHLKYIQMNDSLVSISNNKFYSNGETFTANAPTLIGEFIIKIPNYKKDALSEYEALLYRNNGQIVLLIPKLLEPSLHGHQIFKAYDEGLFDMSAEFEKICFLINGKTKEIFGFNKHIIIATYGYAISCHKAQGQEWDNVYIDADWLMPAWNTARWFYTAITRAKCKVQVKQNKYLTIN
jgi:ATP-dependent exoDNAse (exonuclease V) alpha subunit